MMTVEEKKEWLKQVISFVLTILASLVIFSFTINRENKTTVNNELNRLDKDKVNKDEIYNYVDKQDNSIKAEFNSKLDIIIQNQHEANNLLKEISNRR